MADTQYVCTAEICECLDDDDKYSCECRVDSTGEGCVDCQNLVVLIDMDSGDNIPEHRFEEAHDDPAGCDDCWDCGQPRLHAIHVDGPEAVPLAVALARLAAQGTEESDG